MSHASDAEQVVRKIPATCIYYAIALVGAVVLACTGTLTAKGLTVMGGDVPFAFVLFVLVLIGVAFFHHHTLYVALAGALVITTYTAVWAPGTSLSSEEHAASIEPAALAQAATGAHGGKRLAFADGNVEVEVLVDRAAGTLTVHTSDSALREPLGLVDPPVAKLGQGEDASKVKLEPVEAGGRGLSLAWRGSDERLKAEALPPLTLSVHRPGMFPHFTHEGEHTLLNLLGLLLGFALLAKFFEHSHAPDHLPRLLPKSPLWAGFVLLCIVWFISSFLDNIAAAMIGGVMARTAYKGKVTVGYIAAIVAASNAGGAWSVLGDTTTTMMWIDGVSPLDVAHGIVSSTVALLCFGLFSTMLQNKVQPMAHHVAGERRPIDGVSLLIVLLILAGAITTNFLLDKPFVGVWAAILVGALLRKPAWGEIPGAFKGAVFLLSLVWCASLMPVEALPPAGWESAFGLGFVSAVFDNIPLTKLALEQGGYDWGMLAYTVGFGGSMIWFGSSAGVAISKDFPEARNTGKYLKEGWPVVFAYVVGFFALKLTLGFHPHAPHKTGHASPPAAIAVGAPAPDGKPK